MKITLSILITTFYLTTTCKAQKPPIDSSQFGAWPIIQVRRLSDDGRYCMYMVENRKLGTETWHIASTINEFSLEINNIQGSNITFDANSRKVLFLTQADSLGLVQLGRSSISYIPHIRSYKLITSGKSELLTYLANDPSKELTVQDYSSKRTSKFKGIDDYRFSDDGKVLLLQKTEEIDGEPKTVIEWADYPFESTTRIWQGDNISNPIFDKTNHQLAFIAEEKKDAGAHYSVCYYQKGMQAPSCPISDKSPDLGDQFSVSKSRILFSMEGDKLLFGLTKKAQKNTSSPEKTANVYVWNYKDIYHIEQQLSPNFNINTSYWAVMNFKTRKIVRLNEEDENVRIPNSFENYFLVEKKGFRTGFYVKANRPSLYILAAADGRRRAIVEKKLVPSYYLSPGENFVVWFDPDSLNYFSYDIAEGINKDISNSIPYPTYDAEASKLGRPYNVTFNVDAFDLNDHSVFLYDQYDIWKVVLQGKTPPLNVTHGYGRKNNIVFALPLVHLGRFEMIHPNEKVLLSAYDPVNKLNGFGVTNSNGSTDPILKCMQPYCYYVARTGAVGSTANAGGYPPLKAKNSNTFLVQRMDTDEYPNLFVTNDLRSYRQISNLHPERPFNWLRSELVRWKMTDGKWSQGILYKPENFDPAKKYPLIFDYYERRSDELHGYMKPDLSAARINIPYYVSNGYLIFVPDIFYSPGHNGAGILNALESAASFLSTFPWVDSTKLGLQGHSFGGWETNYLITHSTKFAAACEASGASDLVSFYDQDNGDWAQEYQEISSAGGTFGLGVTPWTHPDLYIENSPIFSVDKTITPLLMMHGSRDHNVPFVQAEEMFNALRRAGKKVWLLDYEDGDHGVHGRDAIDFTIRMKQFFDHYLKGAPAPKWMTQGIPAALKGRYSGFDLDLSGQEP